jgi:hypothetical protein
VVLLLLHLTPPRTNSSDGRGWGGYQCTILKPHFFQKIKKRAITLTRPPIVVNDSGVYLPPSPPEKKSFWKKSESSSHSSKVRTPPSEEEQFVIPRESFECYRRSFDISARSPVTDIAPSRGSFDLRPATRASLDVRPTTRASLDVRPSRASLDVQPSARLSLDQRPLRRGPGFSSTLEDAFEEVKLTDEAARPKKRSIFSRFGADHGAGRDAVVMGRKEAMVEVAESELRPITAGRD